jgi:oligopeptidase B
MTSIPQPPVAQRRPRSVTMHGDTRDDPYFWLRDRDNPEVIAYLSAENAYLEQALAHTQPLQQQIYAEMGARNKEIDASVPVQRDNYL